LQIIRTSDALRVFLTKESLNGAKVGFVPTMGALHDGHMALMLRSVAENKVTVLSIFVNPTQFNNAEDLIKYPRQEAADVAMAQRTGVDAVFLPSVEEMYPPTEPAALHFVSSLFDVFEGKHRPGHFAGVVTIVRKLFALIGPCSAYFGEKDFQQLAVVRALVATEALPVRVVPCATVRTPEGLAMSSRNSRLSANGLHQALGIFRAMSQVVQIVRAGNCTDESLGQISEELRDEGFDVEYFSLINPTDFTEIAPTDALPGHRIIAAAWLEGVRLIDNMEV